MKSDGPAPTLNNPKIDPLGLNNFLVWLETTVENEDLERINKCLRNS